MASFSLHEALQQELRTAGVTPYSLDPVRRVMICRDDAEAARLEVLLADFRTHHGFSARWLDRTELQRIDGRLASDIERGLLLEGNRSLDALAFNHAIVDGAQRAGARLQRDNVVDIRPRAGSGYRIHAQGSQCEVDMVVLATGPWVAETLRWLGIDLPVRPIKGEMLRVELEGPALTHDFTNGMTSLYRRGADEVWIGVTREDSGFDDTPTEVGRQHLLEQAARIMPTAGTAQVIEHLASLRPMAPGGLPVIGAAPDLPGVFIANGGGIKGMLTCIGAGRAIRDLIVSGHTHLPIAPFAPRNRT